MRGGAAALAVLLVVAGTIAASPAGAAPAPRAGYAAACRRAATVTAAERPAAVEPVVWHAALPPTPLPIVLRSTATAFTGQVTAVLYQGPPPRVPHRPAGFVGPIPPSRCQVVRVRVSQILLGDPPAQLVVVKPRAPYLLGRSRLGQTGTFLLDASRPYPQILGLYGPSSYAPSAVAAGLAGR